MSWSLGVVPALSAIVKLFSKDGGKVLIQTPVYSEFYDVVEAWGHTVVENKLVESDGRWHIDFDDFAAKAKECDVFLLCNPHNPLGIVWTPEELTKMAEICMEHNTLLVSDEIHSDLIFHGKRHTPTASLSPEITAGVITCISATKTFNLAGLQASTTIFPNAELKAAYDGFWGAWTSTATTPSAPWPWRPPTGRARSGWSSFSPTSAPTLTMSGTSARRTSPRSSPTAPTPPI